MPLSVGSISCFAKNKADLFAIVEKICNWERIEYGEGNHRIPQSLIDCIDKNDKGFLCAFDGSSLVGYADLWQLESSFYKGLKSGLIFEESLDAEHILTISDPPSLCWYLGSVITEPALRQFHSHSIKAALVLARISAQLPGIFKGQQFPAKMLGVASSDAGKKLLAKWEFLPIKRHESAIDFRPRYEKNMITADDSACFSLR